MATELVTSVIPVSGTINLPITVEEAIREWEIYQELTRKILDPSDYQKIGNRQFKKKSAWRKYARYYNITDRVTFEEISRAEDGFPNWARIRVEAMASNGRTAEADHECHVTERCCPASKGQQCKQASWRNHSCCIKDCDGRIHWSHPGDLCATALTRAKNRAISDLIGAGEVSAEEVTEQSAEELQSLEAPRQQVIQRPRPVQQQAPPQEPRKTQWDVWAEMGFEREQVINESQIVFGRQPRDLSADERRALTAHLTELKKDEPV